MSAARGSPTGRPGRASPALGPVILRVASWPIETIDGLRSPGLTQSVDRWIEQEASIREAGATLSELLHPVVPRVADARRRGLILALRRHVFGSADPIPARLLAGVDAAPEVSGDVKAAVSRAADERRRLQASRERLERAYQSAEAAEAAELRRIVGDPAFLKALCLASPAAFASRERAGATGVWTDRLRMALFGYVMRAVGRATPNGLWAGVALEDPPRRAGRTARGPEPGEDREADGSRWTSGWARFDPDLAPFAAAIRAIASRDPGVHATVTLPALYTDAWEALDGVIPDLPEDERPVWRRVVDLLQEICRSLEGDPRRLSLAELRSGEVAARTCVGDLLERYGLPRLTEDARILHADLRAPVGFRLSDASKARIDRTLRDYWAFDRYGLGEIETATARWRGFGRILGDLTMSLADVVERRGDGGAAARAADGPAEPGGRQARAPVPAPAWADGPWEALLDRIEEPSLRTRAQAAFDRWYRELEPVHAHRSHRLAVGPAERAGNALPGGAALLMIGGQEAARIVRLGSVAPDPCLFYSRFHRLFRAHESGQDGFASWYRDGLRRLEAACPGLEFADLAVRLEGNLNAAARPGLARRRVDPLRGDGAAPDGLHLRLGVAGRPVCLRPSEDVTLVPCVHSAAQPDGADPSAEALYEASRLMGRPSLLRPIPLFAWEIAAWRHLPRLTLEDGVVISPERWLPPSSLGETLARSAGLERFVAWRRLVQSTGLPRLVYARYGDHATETLVPTDSVLAVERLGRALAARGPDFRLQEAFPPVDQWWLRDADGRRYLAELAVAWHGDEEFWRTYRGVDRTAHPLSATGQPAGGDTRMRIRTLSGTRERA